jgi:xanthine dehydrogenase/oxidase
MKFTTIEGIGNKAIGYNEIQKRLADYNGSQCGWCSTGMVMNMYSLLLNNPKPSQEHIEKSFDGNICRCTGIIHFVSYFNR